MIRDITQTNLKSIIVQDESQFYANKLGNLGEIDTFLEGHK